MQTEHFVNKLYFALNTWLHVIVVVVLDRANRFDATECRLGKLEKAINETCKKEIKSIDKTVVKFFADQLKKELAKKNKKISPDPVPKVDPKWQPKPPGSGLPSLTIPITEFVMDPKLDTKGKVSIKVWGDPRQFEKADKGVMVNFTVVNW